MSEEIPGIPVCESCIFEITEYAIEVGEDYHDSERIEVLARVSGGDVPDHECDSEGVEYLECSCGCQG